MATGAAAGGEGEVNFSEHIAPLIFENCSGCHHPDAAAPFSLLSYRDVLKRGRLIAEVTRTRYMPPWPAAPGWGEFKGERLLSQEQIDLIRDWVAGACRPAILHSNPLRPSFTIRGSGENPT